jgi:hypothetical protein
MERHGRDDEHGFPEVRDRARWTLNERGKRAEAAGGLDREGFAVAPCSLARRMKGLGLRGIIQGEPHETTILAKRTSRSPDKVNRPLRTCTGSEVSPLSPSPSPLMHVRSCAGGSAARPTSSSRHRA